METLKKWMDNAVLRLENALSPDPESDVRLLVLDGLSLSPAELRARRLVPLAEDERALLDRLLARREAGQPAQYVVGLAWFMGLPFSVDENVLIPRADTETLCEAALDRLQGMPAPQVLDMCTGSGAIGVSVGHYRPDAQVTLADISEGALSVAQKNARLHAPSAECIQTDLFSGLAGRKFDLIACNPPYIPTEELASLQKEVQKEPSLALDGGKDGLDFYRRLAEEAPKHLLPGGHILLEVGMGQARDVANLFSGKTEILNDLNGVERVVCIRSEHHAEEF